MSMRRVTFPAILLAGPALVLGGCSGGDEVARDEPAPQEPAATSPADDGGFAPSDYDYTLTTACFCPYGGVPVRVSVRADSVVGAVFARGGGRGGAVRGEDAPESLALSIEDLLARAEEARAQGAHEVRVRWPEGAEAPSEVSIDRDERMVDEELGWTISDVDVLG
jgi:hypothetical protein